jgi:uncharacterized protein (DUF4415 family)
MSEHGDIHKLTEEDFARARPFKDAAFPEQYRPWWRRGWPPMAQPKEHVRLSLATDVAQNIKAAGCGCNGLVEEVLRAALARGEL